MMKIFGLLDKFLIEFNISLSIGIGSHIDDLGRGIVVVSNNWEFKAFGPLGLPHVPRVHGIPGEDFALAIKTTRLSSLLEDVKFLFNLSNMLVMDRSIGLCYQKLRFNEKQTNDEKNKDGGGSSMAVCGESPRASKIIAFRFTPYSSEFELRLGFPHKLIVR
uniref:Uncharacterized protein n=1 Tax=Vitis vinifera TaxID=29760 RepID=A5C940_VITVI|nr:hypothetical protein VITISV_012061 [Vitis vinifera]